MRKVLLLVAVIFSFAASAQSWQPVYGNQRFGGRLAIPVRDTLGSAIVSDSGQIVMRPQDSLMYYKYNGYWNALTTSTSALLKLNISDTLNMLNNRISSITLNNTGILHTTPLTFTRAGGAWSATQTLATQTANTVFAAPNGSTGTPTFRSLVLADMPAQATLTATNSTLTFSGSYNGLTAQTVGLNLANANTWTGLQTFSATTSITNQVNLSTTSGKLSWGSVGGTLNNILLYDGGATYVRTGFGSNAAAALNVFAKSAGTINFGIGFDATTLTTSNAAFYVNSSNQLNFGNTVSGSLSWGSVGGTLNNILLYDGGNTYVRTGFGSNAAAALNVFAKSAGTINFGIGLDASNLTTSNSAFYVNVSNQVVINTNTLIGSSTDAGTGILQVTGNTALTGTLAVSGGIIGTATNSGATAGKIGENVESEINTATNYTTTATYQPVTSITLTAGDWDLSAIGTFNTNTATITAAANAIFVVSTTTASATGATAKNTMFIPQAALLGTSAQSSSSANYRVSIASTTTFFINTQATFTLGNPQFTGFIRARRMR